MRTSEKEEEKEEEEGEDDDTDGKMWRVEGGVREGGTRTVRRKGIENKTVSRLSKKRKKKWDKK